MVGSIEKMSRLADISEPQWTKTPAPFLFIFHFNHFRWMGLGGSANKIPFLVHNGVNNLIKKAFLNFVFLGFGGIFL